MHGKVHGGTIGLGGRPRKAKKFEALQDEVFCKPLHPMQVRYQTALQPDELGPTGVVSCDGEVYIGKL